MKNSSSYRILIPVWMFLNQRLFDASSPMIWSPKQFWFVYRIQYLERCLEKMAESKKNYRN